MIGKPYNSAIGLNEKDQIDLAKSLGLSALSDYLSKTATKKVSRHKMTVDLETKALAKLNGKRPFQ